jgi:hypothetical protein
MRIQFLVITLSFLLVIPPVLAAQTQAVSPSELQEAIKNSAQTRQKTETMLRHSFQVNLHARR